MRDGLLKISFGGDLMCLQAQNEAVLRKYGTYNYKNVMSGLKPLLLESDMVLANLETPVSEANLSEEQICFNTPDSFLDAIKDAGIGFLQTCNNHCLDRGVDGIVATLENLDKRGIDHYGTYLTREDSERVYVKEIAGVKIAVVCCTFGTNSEHNGVILSEEEQWRVDLLKRQNKKSRIASRVTDAPMITRMIPDNVSVAAIKNAANVVFVERIKAKIEQAKREADIVILMPHIGGQYNPAPGAYTKWTIDWMSRHQPSVIVAGHPHVPLRTETINGVFTAFSLGNLTFTPGVGYYLANVLADYGIVLHTWWSVEDKQLKKVTFNVVKNVIGEDGISYVRPLYDIYQDCVNAIERDCLAIDNEAIVNRLCGTSVTRTVKNEYEILINS
jgi:poly-gamma-glutamate synthesis protein (capsule biosynthesis protein)